MHPILVVGDDRPLKTMLQDFLEDEGYRVVTASTQQEFHPLLLEHHPRLIILDLATTLAPFPTLLTQIAPDDTQLPPVLLLSSVSNSVQTLRSVDRHLAKPFPLDSLSTELTSLLH